MKKVIAILIFATAVAASAQFVGPNGEWSASWPVQIGTTYNPTPAMCEAAGWREATAQEIADKAAAEAAAQAEAEAAATLPLQSATGFAVQDSDGHWIELEPTGDGLPVIGVQVSNSPLTPEERAAMKAQRKAAHDAMKAAAKGAKNNNEKIDLLMRAVFGIDE